ncbi:MAG TPA: glycosyltransferase family 9 protein [Gemmatimonadaceae bacterium]|nr:glycosyltransferase family 9 protein [Gemmatimonadaceae bacterium]
MKGAVPGSICIVMMSAVGDAVHVLPVINALKRENPRTRITWILQPGPATLVRGHRSVDEIIVFERSRGWRAFADIRAALARRTFDLVINLQVYFKAGIVTAFARAPVKLGFDRARARDFNWMFTNRKIEASPVRHVQDQYFEFLNALGVSPEPVEWDIGPWSDEREWQHEFVAKIGRPIAAIVVATSKAEKDWPAERWAEVCDLLYSRFGLQPVLVGGRSGREVAAERIVMEQTEHKPVSQLGSGLRKLVSILDASALVLSPDTGPLHMTVALDRPVISLLGYTNPRRTGPYRKFQDLVIDAYGDPGEDYPVSMENRTGRMPRISVADVITKVELWEERYRGKQGAS